jgi:hypothetical protein
MSTTQPLQTIINGITENWNIVTIANTILTLSKIPSGSLPAENYNGDYLIEFIYFYENVLFTNQTNETYALIEGVANPNDYSNLDYSWSRNIQRWYPYLASATKFKPNDVIKTSSFKINGNLVTRKDGEGANVSDSADINNAGIASLKILNPFNHSVKVYAPFNVVTQLIEDIRDVKGYVSVNLNDGRMIKGYIQNMEYTWITEELDLVLEEKFISDYGDGNQSIMLLVKNLDLPEGYILSKEEIDEMFSEEEMKKIAVDGTKFISYTKTTIENKIAVILEVEKTAERLDIKTKIRMQQYMFIHNNKMYCMEGMVSTKDLSKDLAAEMKKYNPVFRLVANSIVLKDKYR